MRLCNHTAYISPVVSPYTTATNLLLSGLPYTAYIPLAILIVSFFGIQRYGLLSDKHLIPLSYPPPILPPQSLLTLSHTPGYAGRSRDLGLPGQNTP